jgi:hypothetical protein
VSLQSQPDAAHHVLHPLSFKREHHALLPDVMNHQEHDDDLLRKEDQTLVFRDVELQKLKQLGIEMTMDSIEPSQRSVNHCQSHLSQLSPTSRELLIDRGLGNKSRGLESPLNLVSVAVQTTVSAPSLSGLKSSNPCPSDGGLPIGVKESVLLVVGHHHLTRGG